MKYLVFCMLSVFPMVYAYTQVKDTTLNTKFYRLYTYKHKVDLNPKIDWNANLRIHPQKMQFLSVYNKNTGRSAMYSIKNNKTYQHLGSVNLNFNKQYPYEDSFNPHAATDFGSAVFHGLFNSMLNASSKKK